MKTFLKITLISIIFLSVAMSLALICGAMFINKYSDSHVDDELLRISRSSSQTLFYYYSYSDREKSIGNAHLIEGAKLDNGVKYEYVSYDRLPKHLINAFIAIEDKRFEQHNGIDYLRSAKAVINYVAGGKSTFGGSTITQQLVKNITGNDQFDAKRKISEAFSAIDLEEKYDKTEIMEMYLNVINLASGCRGVGAAANYYYSKEPSELTLSECATIAAITNNPSKYNPLKNPENNKHRRDLVLSCMLREGYITQQEHDEARDSDIKLNISPKSKSGHVNSWYIDMVTEDVINDLSEKYDITRSTAALMLYNGGYKIYTAMDASIQNIIDEYYSNQYNFPIDSDGNMPESSMIVINPHNGDILGVAGGVGAKSANRVQNYATDTKRPPGSAIKPLSVYAPALDKGIIKWSTIVSDSPVKDGTDGYKPWPGNADGIYRGNVTVQYAVEQSLNTVAVKVLDMLGNKDSIDFLNKKLHITGLDEKKDSGDAALALGQPSEGITLRELTAAYSILEDGVMSKPRSYYKVTDSNGKIILDNSASQEPVISRASAAIMTKLLQTVVKHGTAKGKITLADTVEVAGKTGTSQNNCDRYFVGYTPKLLGGVWFGYEYPKSLSEFSGNFSATVWDEIMSLIYESSDFKDSKKTFDIPDNVQKLTYNLETGEAPNLNDNYSLIEDGWFAIRDKES